MNAIFQKHKAHAGRLEEAVFEFDLVRFGLGIAQVVLLDVEGKHGVTLKIAHHEIHLLAFQALHGAFAVSGSAYGEHVAQLDLGQDDLARERVVQVGEHAGVLGHHDAFRRVSVITASGRLAIATVGPDTQRHQRQRDQRKNDDDRYRRHATTPSSA